MLTVSLYRAWSEMRHSPGGRVLVKYVTLTVEMAVELVESCKEAAHGVVAN